MAMGLGIRACVVALAGAMCTPLACAQRLSQLATPRPVPRGGTLVVGLLGGFERWDDPQRSVRKLVLDLRGRGLYAESLSNHRWRVALKLIRMALDVNHDGHLDLREAAAARVILFGQSWGGDAVLKLARALNRQRVPVLLTVQVDSVGLHDAVIPPNVRAAANLYQHDLLTIQGRSEIHAADPARTRILGNFRYSYDEDSVDMSGASWPRRHLGGSHARMEQDPRVWAEVERLILDATTM